MANLGLQRRIMLYVAAGLAAMFGVIAILGFDAIDEAAQLVYQERLTTAHTTAGIFERDFARIASTVAVVGSEVVPGSTPGAPAGPASRLLARFSLDPDLSAFFRVRGVWLVDGRGRLLDQAGEPNANDEEARRAVARLVSELEEPAGVVPGVGSDGGALPFAMVLVRIHGQDDPSPVAVVHTVALNRTEPYVPADHGLSTAGSGEARQPVAATEAYHLEVIGPDGRALLGIGPDERPGELSPHFAAIGPLMAARGAATQLHDPQPGDGQPHVMAAAPLGSSSLYVVLEQPVDIALALPQRLRERLSLLIGAGFLLTLLVAWVTTRRVVTPTEQLTRAARRIADGDLTSPIGVAAQDEIGQLAESLEAMRGRLREALDAIERTNRELETRVADRTARLDRVLRTTISAQEDERYRLARELHDETAQALAALAIGLDRARDALGDTDATTASRARILEARTIAARLLEETRRLILGLRPSVLDDLGLVPALRWLCETNLVDRGVEFAIDADHSGSRLPGHVEVALFRIAQEAITNVARHADAKQVRIEFRVSDGHAHLAVADDGRGFDVPEATGLTAGGRSVGLVGMQERVRLLNGTIEIDSSAGNGTRVTVVVPLASGGD
jgi:two-component system sensor histidine kinase UhpB